MNGKKHDIEQSDPEQFWEEMYRTASPDSSGKPGKIFQKFTKSLKPGRALELGCARGDDAVWLAQKGWTVVAVDISSTALSYAAANAKRAGVEDRITFERHTLPHSFPEGSFNLVSASFLQSPVDLDRAEVLKRAAQMVTSGGHLLIIEHGSRAPWSWAPTDTEYPTPEETLSSLSLSDKNWHRVHVGSEKRTATGPEGEKAIVYDNIIFLKRRGKKPIEI